MATAVVVGGHERRKNEKKGKREKERKKDRRGKGKERARQAGQWPRSEQRGGGHAQAVRLGSSTSAGMRGITYRNTTTSASTSTTTTATSPPTTAPSDANPSPCRECRRRVTTCKRWPRGATLHRPRNPLGEPRSRAQHPPRLSPLSFLALIVSQPLAPRTTSLGSDVADPRRDKSNDLRSTAISYGIDRSAEVIVKHVRCRCADD